MMMAGREESPVLLLWLGALPQGWADSLLPIQDLSLHPGINDPEIPHHTHAGLEGAAPQHTGMAPFHSTK